MPREKEQIDKAAAALGAMETVGVDPTELMEVLSGFTLNLGFYAGSNLRDEKALKVLEERMQTPQDIGDALDAAHYEAEQRKKAGALAKAWQLVGPLLLDVLSKVLLKG